MNATQGTLYENITTITAELLERYTTDPDSLEGEIEDEGKVLLADRDMVMSAVSQSHDLHLGKLLQVEDDLKARDKKELKEMIDVLKKAEWDRNRTNVADFKKMFKKHMEEMDDAVVQAQEDEDNDDY